MTLREVFALHDLSAYVAAFEAQHVPVSDLPHLSDEELRLDFGVTSYVDRKRFRAMVASLSGAPGTPSHDSGATRMAPPPADPGATRVGAASSFPPRLGSYRVLGLLGAGGMGTVVRARHVEEGWAVQQGGDVALKLIHPEIAASGEFRSRFMSEAGLGRRLQHVGLVPVYDVVSEGPWLGTVMGLVVGESLSARVRPGGLALAEAIGLLSAVGETLDYLHGQGVVHRDVKPANIVVRLDGRPVLLDLGIAKDTVSLSKHTGTLTTLGTSVWMAPEQVDAKAVNGAADRYALGLLAYALLTGRMPWGADTSEVRILANKLMGQLESLSSVRAGLPGHVSAAVTRMVSVSAGERFPSCGSFVEALRRDVEGEERAAREVQARAARDQAERQQASKELEERAAQERTRAAKELEARESAEWEAKEPDGVAALAARRQSRAGAGATPKAAPAGWPPLPTTGRSAPPGTVMGPTSVGPQASAPPVPPAPPVMPVPGPTPAASPAEGPVPAPAAPAPSTTGGSKLPLLLAGVVVLARIAWLALRGPSMGGIELDSSPTTTSFGYTLAPVAAGTYTIGSPPTEADRGEDETQHAVTLTRGFLMGTTELTQGQYAALMGTNPVVSDCIKAGTTAAPADDEPVYCVSWVDAAKVANAASAREGLESCYVVSGDTVSWPKGLACTGYRLPTESEWEVAAHGGGGGIYAGGNDLGGLGWFEGNSGGRPHPVGQKSPNGYGLYDMSGNVWEWTWDTFGDYPAGAATDPTGATEGPGRVFRGGSWNLAAVYARAAYRGGVSPGVRLVYLGLRLSRTIP